MKKITIFQENTDSIVLFDDDPLDLISYTKKISEILESTKVCILQVSSQAVSLKPSKLNSILVVEVEDKKTKSKEKVEKENKPQEQVDIIRD